MTSIMVRREKVLEMLSFDRKRVCDNLWAMVEREREGLPFIDYLADKEHIYIDDKGIIGVISKHLYTMSSDVLWVRYGKVKYTRLNTYTQMLIRVIETGKLSDVIKAANNKMAEYIVLDNKEQYNLNKLADFESINKAYNQLREQLKDEYKDELDSIMTEVYL